MRHLFLLAVLSGLAGCVAPGPGRPAGALTEFSSSNFGIRFKHSSDVSTDYEPHGAADRVGLLWKEAPIGLLHVGPLPPAMDPAAFLEAGRAYYAEKLGASSLVCSRYTNPQGLNFHRIRGRALVGGRDHVIDRLVHLQAPQDAPPEWAPLQRLFGSYSFEFVYPQEDAGLVEPETLTIVDSFRIQYGP